MLVIISRSSSIWGVGSRINVTSGVDLWIKRHSKNDTVNIMHGERFKLSTSMYVREIRWESLQHILCQALNIVYKKKHFSLV